jgi:hypothetical protein
MRPHIQLFVLAVIADMYLALTNVKAVKVKVNSFSGDDFQLRIMHRGIRPMLWHWRWRLSQAASVAM